MAGRQAAGKEIIRVNKNGGKTSAAKWREEEMLLGQYRSSRGPTMVAEYSH
jgi:hypothetical protein